MTTEARPKRNLYIAILLAFAGLGAFLLLLWSTPLGPGVSPDSTVYFDAARSLLAGHGFESAGKPLTHYPPVYPALLALSGLPGAGLLEAARWLHALFFALNAVLLGLTVYLAAERSAVASACAALLFLSSAQMLRIHAMAWSESPFLCFSLAAYLLLALHLSRPRTGLLLASALCLALALATRYAGLALLPPAVLAILIFEEKSRAGRVKDALLLVALAAAPLLVWFLRNAAVAGTAANRTFAFHPVQAGYFKTCAGALYRFWLPGAPRHLFATPGFLSVLRGGALVGAFALGGGALVAAFAWGLRNDLREKRKATVGTLMQALAVLFAISYFSFLCLSISFVDAGTPLDARLLLPLHVLGVVFFVSVAWKMSAPPARPALRWAFLALVLVLAGANAGPAWSLAAELRTEGNGYNSPTWRESEGVAYARALPAGIPLYSDSPDAIQFHAGREAAFLPAKVLLATRGANPDFEAQMQALGEDMERRGAVIIYFDNAWRGYLPAKKELEQVYGIPVLRQLRDATVYGHQ